jgi:hypothetical protein
VLKVFATRCPSVQRVVVVVCVAHVLVIQVGKQRRIEEDLSSRKEARRPRRYDRLPDAVVVRVTVLTNERLMVVEIFPSLLFSSLLCPALLCSALLLVCFLGSSNICFVLLLGTGRCWCWCRITGRRSLGDPSSLAQPSCPSVPLIRQPVTLRIDLETRLERTSR